MRFHTTILQSGKTAAGIQVPTEIVEALGVKTQGPTKVITDLCVFEPDPATRELTVVSLHPGITGEAVQAQCAWKVRFANDIGETPAPTEAELAVLRELQARTARAHGGDA